MSMGTAKPMPMKTVSVVGLARPTTMPTTSPSRFSSGPPELPGFTAASNWIMPGTTSSVSGRRKLRSRPETTPAVVVWRRPKGLPTATTSSPTLRAPGLPMTAGADSGGGVSGCSMAMSWLPSCPAMMASDWVPSA